MSDEVIERLEDVRRHSRDVTYSSGKWYQLAGLIPTFELADFRAGDSDPANPHLKAVIRLPLKPFERRIPVGVVSNSYPLAQHAEVADQCFRAIRSIKLKPEELKCDLGLTDLGEWMNLRIYFPIQFSYVREGGDSLDLRVECFNSVDGSGRLILFLSWIRFICSNGMVISDTMSGLRDTHDRHLNLEQIPDVIHTGLEKVRLEIKRLRGWEDSPVNYEVFEPWINKDVSGAFNQKAACRAFYICKGGYDVELTNPAASGPASQKPVTIGNRVPGSPEVAETLFDVSQALSWVATQRVNADERLEWQRKIPRLLESLAAASA